MKKAAGLPLKLFSFSNMQAFPKVWSQFFPWAPAPQEVGRAPLNFDMPELGPRDPQAGYPTFPWPPALPSLPRSGLPGPKENAPTVTP